MTINCLGQLIDLSSPKVMGILNLTPDSFYDGNRFTTVDQILAQVGKMIDEGATFIDVGACSSKPGAAQVSEAEEKNRLLPVVKQILKTFPQVLLSIDTTRSEVAKASLNEGAAVINDISAGLFDDKMMPVVANFKVPYVMMHMRGTPQTMSTLTDYGDITKDILFYFAERIAAARSIGINDLIIDPGFGFAKTIEQNYELLGKLDLLQNLDFPILVGLSRKSMIYKTLRQTPADALNGTSVLHTISLMKGASILRVHDVKEAKECIDLVEKLNVLKT